MKRLIGFLLAAIALVVVSAPRAPAEAQHIPIGYVRVLKVTQTPYSPIKFRVAVKAPVGLTVSVGFKIFDARGRSVFHDIGRSLSQPYPETALTLSWNKRGYDGNAAPTGRVYYMVPYGADMEDRDGDDESGGPQLVRGRRVQFVLEGS